MHIHYVNKLDVLEHRPLLAVSQSLRFQTFILCFGLVAVCRLVVLLVETPCQGTCPVTVLKAVTSVTLSKSDV